MVLIVNLKNSGTDIDLLYINITFAAVSVTVWTTL